jgi:hypothetical protein
MHITTKVVSLNTVHGEVCSIQHYVIKFVSDLRQVDGFLRSPPRMLTINTIFRLVGWFMVLNATFNNISDISWRSVLLVEYPEKGSEGNRSARRKPPICRKSLTNFITLCCIEYISPWTGFKLTGISNYHTISTTTVSGNIGYTRRRQTN